MPLNKETKPKALLNMAKRIFLGYHSLLSSMFQILVTIYCHPEIKTQFCCYLRTVSNKQHIMTKNFAVSKIKKI